MRNISTIHFLDGENRMENRVKNSPFHHWIPHQASWWKATSPGGCIRLYYNPVIRGMRQFKGFNLILVGDISTLQILPVDSDHLSQQFQ